MYHLAKFCRICIKTGVKLLDINTIDFDSVSISDKLTICTRMVINQESLSTEICEHCINKLRISYEFHSLCKQSTKKLQGYLSELLSASTTIKPETETFVNSDLRVTLTPLGKPTFKRKRITKEQRCSLLKKLLSRRAFIKKEKIHKRRRYHKLQNATSVARSRSKASASKSLTQKATSSGGLRSIIDFTINYDFGYKVDGNHNDCCDITPLNRLSTFTDSFFRHNFADFRNTILYLIESKDNMSESDDDEEMFDRFPPDCEELIVEPDIKIKTESDEYEDCDSYSCNYYVETSYSDSECKKENVDSIDLKHEQNFEEQSTNSVQMLDKLVDTLGQQKRSLSQHSVRCRTRGNPYINPKLRQQFQYKSFQCEKCNRYFKSPGYLKAHVSKIHS